jgi:predicted MPP superfamily phosphohydrolase
VREALEQNGIKVLENETFKVDVRRDQAQGTEEAATPLWLVGLADLWTRPQRIDETLAQVPEGAPMIALATIPISFLDCRRAFHCYWRVILTAGRSGFRSSAASSIRRTTANATPAATFTKSGHHLFVTTGIGTSIVRVRFNVPPEIVLLTVKSQ